MKKLYRGLSLAAALMLLFTSVVLAQERVVTGAVTDENGTAMPGVNVLLKGTTQGTASDADGKFSISVPNDQATLVISFVGYSTTEVVVGSRTNIAISMSPDVTTLNELVVTGYAIQEKKDVTGSVGIVKPAELTAMPTGNVTSQLQGRVAGVTVTGNGQPGSSSKVRIRGFSSVSGQNDPLYVVDGVPTNDVSTLNPNDIELTTVLKDAGAASIYGSRASNGVILITTKSGVNQGVKVNYSMFAGTQYAGKGPENLLNTQEYADLQWLVYDNDGTVETHPIYGPSTNASPTLPSWADDTNWYDEITDNASIQNHDISLQGGNQNAKFYSGLNYFKQNGIVNTTFTQRVAARLNSEFNVKNRVKFGENFTATHRSGLSVGNLEEGSPISMAVYRAQPIIPVRITDPIAGIAHNFVPGEYGGTGIAQRLGNGTNSVANLERNQDDRFFDIRMLGSIYADVKIIEGLNFKTQFGGTFSQYYNSDYNFATYENAENTATPSLTEGGGHSSDWVWTNTLTYNKKFGDHSLLLVGGYEAVKAGIGRGLSGTRAGYFSDAVSYRTLTNGASTTALSSFYNTPFTLVSNFLRADYSFQDKYLLSATVRRDGSSRFSENNKWGTFPSVTAGWRISQESFLTGNEVISDLKLRAGWGQMGNQGALDPANQYYLYGGDIAHTAYAIGGGSAVQGFRPTRIGNFETQWEAQTTTNIGLDIALLDNKFELSVDYYMKTSDKLLVTPEKNGMWGDAAAPAINIGEMENNGIDLQLIYRQQFDNDLRFEANLNYTMYRNELVALAPEYGYTYFFSGDSRIGAPSRNEVGRPMGSFYGYQVIGLFQSQAEVDAAPDQDGAEAGFFQYADINDDGVIDDNDRTYIGDPNPDFTYGLNLTLGYKAFDLTAFFYGSVGNDIVNYNKWWTDFWPSFQGQKSVELLNDSWTAERGGNSVPKASNKSNLSTNTVFNSYYIEKGSFFRMKNIQLGYNIPQETAGKIGLSSARVYLQGINLFTITDYSGLDPELGGGDQSFGVDEGNYPAVKQFLVGVNVGF